MDTLAFRIGTESEFVKVVTDIPSSRIPTTISQAALGLDGIYIPWCDVTVECDGFKGSSKVYILWTELHRFAAELASAHEAMSGTVILDTTYSTKFRMALSYDDTGRLIVSGYLGSYPFSTTQLHYTLELDQSYANDLVTELGRIGRLAKGRTP